MKKKTNIHTFLLYAILILTGTVMIYPLLWMVSATFKTNSEISSGISLLIKEPVPDGYLALTENYGGNINCIKALLNTFTFLIPKVLFTVISSMLTAYGFGRFSFPMKKFLFALLIGTMFLPDAVMAIPQFILFSRLGLVDSPLYSALVIPSVFAFDSYFVFLLVQFLKGVPKELDDAARIDGCSSFQILVYIIAPVLKPALVSCAVFQFIWTSNDFMGPLLYVNTPSKYPLSVFIRLAMDAESGFQYNRVLASALFAVIPSLTVFFCSQRSLTESITSGAVKG
ncbi:carbohydrate ABC transporter permease [Ruminococcus sp. HUN007]|uniref:carbohydrate ABC transporter permease n=1 Tax=Ruminococcus sp. HUN007 TaxID=1514668 RepID=UPI0005D2A3A3|nr:carbohydrate ABC transporter permease [Ruminococcus sp. HUN007]